MKVIKSNKEGDPTMPAPIDTEFDCNCSDCACSDIKCQVNIDNK